LTEYPISLIKARSTLFKERNYLMTSQTEKVVQVRCPFPLWKAFGWEDFEKTPVDCQVADWVEVDGEGDGTEPIKMTSLVRTQWAYKRQPITFLLICEDEE
jgi:hypothetical protein